MLSHKLLYIFKYLITIVLVVFCVFFDLRVPDHFELYVHVQIAFIFQTHPANTL